jgi:hypothetical protein
MGNFLGGSAYTMATGIADGYHAVTERTFRVMTRPELDAMTAELDKHLREIRGEQAPTEDIAAIQQRNRKIQRLTTALMILRVYRQKRRI